jgi:ATP-dependent protease ClpP protease subunit
LDKFKLLAETETETEETPQPEAPTEELIESYWTPATVAYYGLASRAIALFGPIEPRLSLGITSQILSLAADDPKKPIRLHLNTPGGTLSDCMLLYDVIRASPCVVIATVLGLCASAGVLVLAAADLRLSMPNARFFYHQLQYLDQDLTNPEQARSLATDYLQAQTLYDDLIRKRSGISKRDWKKHFAGRTAKCFGPAEAMQLGIIDAIHPYPKKQVEIAEESKGEEENGK